MTRTIRLANPGDAAAFLEIYGPAISESAISFELEVPSVDSFAARMQAIQAKYPWICLCSGHQVAGFAYASEHRSRAAYQWCVEISAYVHPDFRGQKVGKSLYSRLFHILSLQGFYNAYAGITLPNQASIALHESMGMRLLGVYQNIGYKLGSWHDVGWWQLELNPRDHTPLPPKQLQAIGIDSTSSWLV